jgi:hypothetical protein
MAIGETYRRRAKQVAYNEANGITPTTIVKAIDASLVEMYSPEWAVVPEIDAPKKGDEEYVPPHELPDHITELRRQMMEAADKLEYERAAELRDRIKRLERQVFGMERPPGPVPAPRGTAHSRPSDARASGGAGSHPAQPMRGLRERDQSKGTSEPEKQGVVARGRAQSGRGKDTNGKSGRASSPKQGRLKLVPDRPD